MKSSITFECVTIDVPVPKAVGDLLLKEKIFSEGNDFTSEGASRPDYQGTSLLKPFWEGKDQMFGLEHMKEMELVVVKDKGCSIGVVAWVKPHHGDDCPPILCVPEVMANSNHHPKKQITTAHLGLVMTYLHKPYRRQGIMKHAIKEFLSKRWEESADRAHQHGAFPVISAADGSANLVEQLSIVPLIDNIVSNPAKMSRSFKTGVWAFWTDSLMHYDEPAPWDKWIQRPTSLVPPPKPRKVKR